MSLQQPSEQPNDFGFPSDQKGPFWVVYEGREPGVYDSWPKAKYQVNGVSGSCHKKFSTLYEAIDSFTDIVFSSQITTEKVQNATLSQTNTISGRGGRQGHR